MMEADKFDCGSKYKVGFLKMDSPRWGNYWVTTYLPYLPYIYIYVCICIYICIVVVCY